MLKTTKQNPNKNRSEKHTAMNHSSIYDASGLKLFPPHSTDCNYFPPTDRNPISDSVGSLRVELRLTTCHHFSQTKLPEDALDFAKKK